MDKFWGAWWCLSSDRLNIPIKLHISINVYSTSLLYSVFFFCRGKGSPHPTPTPPWCQKFCVCSLLQPTLTVGWFNYCGEGRKQGLVTFCTKVKPCLCKYGWINSCSHLFPPLCKITEMNEQRAQIPCKTSVHPHNLKNWTYCTNTPIYGFISFISHEPVVLLLLSHYYWLSLTHW